jgi:outer membrane protein
MKGFRLVILFLIFSLQGFAVFAQSDSVMRFSLVEAQNFANDNFFESKNAALDIKEAKKKILETTAIGLPQAKASASYQYIPGDLATMSLPFGPNGSMIDVPLNQRNTTIYGGTITQLVFSGEYIVGLQASKTYKEFSEENYEKKKIDVKEMVATSYFGLLVLKENRKTQAETLINLQSMYDETNKTAKIGLTDQTNADQLKLSVDNTTTQLRGIDNQIAFLTKLFKYQIGLVSDQNIELTDSLDKLITESIINTSAYRFDIDNVITYQLLSTQEKLMALNLKREKSTFLPTIAGFYQYQDYAVQPDIRFTPKNILGLQINFPLFTSGSRYAKVGEAKIEYEKVSNQREQMTQLITYQAQQSIDNYNTALDSYNDLKEGLALSKKIFDQATLRFKVGMMSSLDYTTTSNQYLQTLRNFSMATQALLTAKIALDKAYNKL